MSPIMVNFKDGHGHRDIYLDTILYIVYIVTRNADVQYESSDIYYLKI